MPMVEETRANAANQAEKAHTATPESQAVDAWKPKILTFACNWCTYAGADLAGLNRMNIPASIHLLRVPCSGRVNPQYILEALQKGCDGVLVCGCHPGDCHYSTGNYFAKRRLMVFKRFLEYMGVEPERFDVRWISASEAARFRDVTWSFVEGVRRVGPVGKGLELSQSAAEPYFGKRAKTCKPADDGADM